MLKKLINPIFLFSAITWRLRTLYKLYVEIAECKKILKKLSSKNSLKLIVVYDNLVSPPTYGDLLVHLMLCRILAAMGFEVNLIFIDKEYRSDWAALNNAQEFTREQAELSNYILKGIKSARINWMSWTDFNDGFLKNKNNHYILFEDKVSKRGEIYMHSFDLINMLYLRNVYIDKKMFLLSSDDVGGPRFKSSFGPYITLGVRRNLRWGAYNSNDEEFIEQCAKLLLKFPEHKIIVVSDFAGCNHFRIIAQANDLDLLFSKDYTSCFTEDLSLILKSSFHFQHNGGGINVIPMFSDMPYFIVELVNHRLVNGINLTSWQNERQFFQRTFSFDTRAQDMLQSYPNFKFSDDLI